MEKTLMEIIDKLMKIEDDEQFCIAEYDAVQDYCYKKDFQLSKEERQIIRDIGLEESFFSWMEDRGKRIGYQVVYEYKGYLLSAGNPQIFPEKEIAEKYRRNYLKYPWADQKLFLEEVLPMLQTMDIPSKRDQYRIQEVLDAATFLLHVSNQYIDPDFSYEQPEVFITEDEILQYLCSGSGFENGKYRIWSFCKEDHLVKEISEFLKNEYGNGGHNSALSGDFFSDANYDSKGIRLTKAGCTVQLSWMEAAKKIRCLIHADQYLTQSEKEYINHW